MYARIYCTSNAASTAMEAVARQTTGSGCLPDYGIVKIDEPGSGSSTWLVVSDSYEEMLEAAGDIALACGMNDVEGVEALALDADRIESVMIEEAVARMTSFYGDIAYDLQTVRGLGVGRTAYWYVRTSGTKMIIGDHEHFASDIANLGGRVMGAYRIHRYDKTTYIISKYK